MYFVDFLITVGGKKALRPEEAWDSYRVSHSFRNSRNSFLGILSLLRGDLTGCWGPNLPYPVDEVKFFFHPFSNITELTFLSLNNLKNIVDNYKKRFYYITTNTSEQWH